MNDEHHTTTTRDVENGSPSLLTHHCLACEERAYRDGYVAGVKTVANKGKTATLTTLLILFYLVCIVYMLRAFAEEETPKTRTVHGVA